MSTLSAIARPVTHTLLCYIRRNSDACSTVLLNCDHFPCRVAAFFENPLCWKKKKGLGALYRSAFIFPPCTAVPFLFPLIYPKKSTNSSPYFKKIFSHMFSGCGIIGAPINLHRRKELRELRLYCNAALVVTNHSSQQRDTTPASY
jgi:hypothetical protein